MFPSRLGLQSSFPGLDVDTINDHALLPAVAHLAGGFVSSVVRDQSADHVQRSIDTGRNTTSGQHTEASQAQVGALQDALATVVAQLEAHASLASGRHATAVGLLDGRWQTASRALAAFVFLELLAAQDIRVVVFVLAEIEAQVVDDLESKGKRD